MPRVCWEEQLCVSWEFVTKFAVYGFFPEHNREYRLEWAEQLGTGFTLPSQVGIFGIPVLVRRRA